MLKASDNPPALSLADGAVADLTGRWWIAPTKSRSEKAFAWDLVNAGVGYYLPMIQRTTFSGGRKRRTIKPLFISYLFMNGDGEDRVVALAHRPALHRDPRDRASAADRGVIDDLTGAGGSPELDLYPHAAVGRRCKVTDGPFMGMEGIVVN